MYRPLYKCLIYLSNLNYITMKKLSLFILAFALFTIQATAAITGPVKPNTALRADLVELIGTECTFELDKDVCTAEVLFTVNSNGEVIVISVNSPNPHAEAYIKSKINYKKVNHKVKKEGELYLLPIRIVKP